MEILIPLGFFAMITAIVVVPAVLKSRERQKMAEAIRVALERGQPMPPELIDAMSSNVREPKLPPSPQRDLRTGIIWVGVSLGLVALGLIVGMEEPDASYWFVGFAAFPGFVGLAYIILGMIQKSKA
jgi:Domain of unknown function (DUF6249)